MGLIAKTIAATRQSGDLAAPWGEVSDKAGCSFKVSLKPYYFDFIALRMKRMQGESDKAFFSRIESAQKRLGEFLKKERGFKSIEIKRIYV